MRFRNYVALGDSMSIDLYADLDYTERRRRALGGARLGAASLLARNNDQVWPEFAGRDLATRCPGIEARMLAADGATTRSVLAGQLGALRSLDRDAETLVTLTAGGNDLLALIGAPDTDGRAGVRNTLENVGAIIDGVQEHIRRATVLIANVYDPTDGSGDLDGARLRQEEMRWLADYNEGVRRLCADRGLPLVDVHGHFARHGRSAPPPERWYWTGSLIEPGFVGASEIRRLWLDALDDLERPRRP
jgi:lysophospholipase L1-like esterase